MSFNKDGEEGIETEIVAKQNNGKVEPKKKNRKKNIKENTSKSKNDLYQDSQQNEIYKNTVKRKQSKQKQKIKRKEQSKNEKSRQNYKDKQNNGKQKKKSKSTTKQSKKNNKEKKIKKKVPKQRKPNYSSMIDKADLYEEELQDKSNQEQNSITNQNNKSQSETTEHLDEVKHELQNSSQSDQENIREIYMAQKLHAFRDQLQITEIMNINQDDLKCNKSAQLKMKDSNAEDDTPNDSEIEHLIRLMGKKYPSIDLQKTVDMLYKCLIKKDSKGNDCMNIQEQLLKGIDKTANQKYAKLMKCVQGNLRALVDKSSKNIVKRYIKNPKYEERFQRDEDRTKYSQKQIVAKAFCERQYGMPALTQQLRESGAKIIIERNRYKSIVTCVVNEAYRRLEDFLIEECKRDIKPLNREEIRTLYTTLLNCRTNFEDQECLTFLKFIKLAFQVQSVTITEQAAIKLYIVIQRALKLRIGELQLDRMYDTMRCNKEFKARRSFQNQKFQIHRIWNNEIETEFLNFYKRNQEFAKIRDYFKTKYVENQHLFTIDSLRSRFHKIMRMSLRKTNCFCQKFGPQRVPQMIKLNDVKAKFLLRSPDALSARLLLVDMYLNDQCDIKRLYQTVSAVNEFVIMKDNERMNQMIQAEPLLNSAAQKIQHNVSISKTKAKTKSESSNQLFYKGKEMNYDHIVQVANGKNLHYYRKPAENQLRDFKEKDIKVEETEGTVRAIEGRMQTLLNEFADNDKWLGSSYASRHGSAVSQASMKMSQQSFNKMIQEQMQKFKNKPNQNYSLYK